MTVTEYRAAAPVRVAVQTTGNDTGDDSSPVFHPAVSGSGEASDSDLSGSVMPGGCHGPGLASAAADSHRSVLRRAPPY